MSEDKKTAPLTLPEDVSKEFELEKPLFPGKFTLPNWGSVDFTKISLEKMKAMHAAGVRGIKKVEKKATSPEVKK